MTHGSGMANLFQYPSRVMRKKQAAHYCDCSIGHFDKLVESGRLPPPILSDSRYVVWDRKHLDAAINAWADTIDYTMPAAMLSSWDRVLNAET